MQFQILNMNTWYTLYSIRARNKILLNISSQSSPKDLIYIRVLVQRNIWASPFAFAQVVFRNLWSFGLMDVIGREFCGGYVICCGFDCMQHYR